MPNLEDLERTIRANELQAFRSLLRDDPSLAAARNSEGGSPALIAIYFGRSAMLDELIANGAVLNIFEAAATGRTDLAAQHLDRDPALIKSYSHDGWTPLHLAAFFGHADTVQALLARGADHTLYGKNRNANQPLHAAAANSQVAACEALLQAGADPSAAAGGGWTPLHLAAANGAGELTQLLLAHGADKMRSKDDGETPADAARSSGHDALAAVLEGEA